MQNATPVGTLAQPLDENTVRFGLIALPIEPTVAAILCVHQ
jgi:hypothetical protein